MKITFWRFDDTPKFIIICVFQNRFVCESLHMEKKLLSVGIFTQRVSFEYTIVWNILPNHVIKMSKGYFYSICKKHFNSHRHICFFKLILSWDLRKKGKYFREGNNGRSKRGVPENVTVGISATASENMISQYKIIHYVTHAVLLDDMLHKDIYQ